MSIEKGVLYVVATPIGNLEDFSPRAAAVLSGVDLVAAEDTRHSRPLLRHFGINTPLTAVHEHNEREVMDGLLTRLQEGQSIALISDAGTPLISDPGFPLVRECHRRGIKVSPIPGPSATVCALSVAGMPTDRFVFEGFLPAKSAARRARLKQLQRESRTLVFYESGHRIMETLQDMREELGDERPALLARELTKLYETLMGDSLAGLLQAIEKDPMQRKGEMVLLVEGIKEEEISGRAAEVERILGILLEELPVKQAATLTARITGEKKNAIYKQALAIKEGAEE
ncbi:16S rRNA (cytidine(1402)-2'-O)-methyltransferase [Pseudomonadota bacterium]